MTGARLGVGRAAAQDGQYLVASTPGSVNEAWLEKVLGEQQVGGPGTGRCPWDAWRATVDSK